MRFRSSEQDENACLNMTIFYHMKYIKYFLRNCIALLPSSDKTLKSRRRFRLIRVMKGEVAIDCGANIGLFTESLAEWGGKVFAFEPNPYAFTELKQKFSDKEQVVCIPKGVYTGKEKKDLYLHEWSDSDAVKWSTGSSLLNVKDNVDENNSIQVEMENLREFIEKLGSRIKVLKMDIEGVEFDVLDDLIESGVIYKIDHVFVETHDHQIPEIRSKADSVRKKIKDLKIENIDLNWH